MDRAVLLVLLGIPILVVIHVAMFWQPIPWQGVVFWTASQDMERPQLHGRLQQPEQVFPAQFVIEHTTQRGS